MTTTNEKTKILQEHILQVLKLQKSRTKTVPVDLVLANGNIILKLFRLEDYNKQQQVLKGLTHQEEYMHPREDREPVYCYFRLDEVKAFRSETLGIDYNLTPENQRTN